MQCGKCGAILEAEVVFCPECGALQESAFSASKVTPPETENSGAEPVAQAENAEMPEEAPAKKGKKLWPIVGCIATVVLIAVAIWVFFALRPTPYTSALDTYIEVAYACDVPRIGELAPKAYWEHLEKNGTQFGLEKMRIGMCFASEAYDRQVYCGKNLKVSYEIKETRNIRDMEFFKKELERDCGIPPESVEEVVIVDFVFRFSGDQLTQMSGDQLGYLVCIDDQWYLAGTTRGGGMTFIPTAVEAGLDLDILR